MIYVIRVQTSCARKALEVLKAAERAAKKAGLPEPTGAFENEPPPVPGPPPPTCGPGETC